MGEEVAEQEKNTVATTARETSDYEQRKSNPSEVWVSQKNRTL